MANKYYLDTCIWLNLFKKEGDSSKGTPYWELAKKFIENIIFSEKDKIYYSGIVLKEIKWVLKNDILYMEKEHFIKKEEKFVFVKLVDEDYVFARKLEFDTNYDISFYDCLHIAVCKRKRFVLVTRDNKLIEVAEQFISVTKP